MRGELLRNGGIACGVVAAAAGAVLGTAWLYGMVDKASRVDALEQQLRSRPAVRITVPSGSKPSSAPTPGSPSPRPSTAPQAGQPNPAALAAAVPPAGTGPTPSAPTSTPPVRPTPPPTPSPPAARDCSASVAASRTSACVIAAATVKASAGP